jgi:hypothetical protein
MSKFTVLGAWNGGKAAFFAGKSAQGFMNAGLTASAAGGFFGSSRKAGDKK